MVGDLSEFDDDTLKKKLAKRKNKKILIILCSLLLLFLLGWYCTRFLPDPRIVEILEMQQKIQNNIKNNGPANLEEAKEIAASAAQIREKT